MFDDSKRLDALEAQMRKVQSSLDGLSKALEAATKSLGGVADGHTALEKQVANLDSDVYRQIGDIRKVRLAPLEDGMKKLQQRCANLEAAVRKLQK